MARNPLTQVQRTTSTQPQPRAIEPIPETYEGDNIPYRGTVNHGVEAPSPPAEVPGWDGTKSVEYDVPEPQKAPVPVRIVGGTTRENTRMRISRTSLVGAGVVGRDRPGDPVLIVGANENRKGTVKLRNLSSDTGIYLGASPPEASTYMGWYLAPGDSEVIETDEDIWGIAEAVSAATAPISLATDTASPGVVNLAGNSSTRDLAPYGGDVASLAYFFTVSGFGVGTADFVVQTSEDGVGWADVPAGTTSGVVQVNANGDYRVPAVAPLGRYVRLRWRNFTGGASFTVSAISRHTTAYGEQTAAEVNGKSGIAEIACLWTQLIRQR